MTPWDFMQGADEIADLRSEDFFERTRLGSDDMDFEAALAQRGCRLKSDEACPDDDGALGLFRCRDDRSAVVERAQIMDTLRAGNVEMHRIGAGREQQPVVGMNRAVFAPNRPGGRIDGDDAGIEDEINPVLRIEFGGAQRDPRFFRLPGEVILRQIGPIDGDGIVRAQQGDRARISLPAQHFRRRIAGRTAADDEHGRGDIGSFQCGLWEPGRPLIR